MRFTLSSIILILANFVYSQVKILDFETHQPIVNAQITVGEKSSFTDENGNFSMDIQSGELIRISVLNYPEVFVTTDDFVEGVYYFGSNSILLDNVVISPTKWISDKFQTGHKTISILPKEVELQNPQTVADLLGISNNVFIQKSQLGGGSPMIRGFSTNRVLITVDGVRMNNAIFRSGNLQNVIAIDGNAIRRTEVLMGPGSLMYGSDAIGGVMNFYTLTPEFSNIFNSIFNGSFMARYSSANNEHTSHVHFNIAGRKFSSLTSFSYTSFSDLKMGRHGPKEYLKNHLLIRENDEDIQINNPNPLKQVGSGYDQYNFMQKFRYAPSKNWELNYGFHYSTTTDVSRYDRFLVYRDGNLRFAEWNYGPQTWMMNNLSVENKQETGIYNQAKLTLAHQYFKESRHSRNAGKTTRTNQYEKVNVVSANFDFYKNIGEKNTLFYGVEGLFNKVGSTADDFDIVSGLTEPIGTRYPDGATWNSYGIYVSNEFNPTKKISIQGGIRYNYVSSKSKFDHQFYDFPFDEATIETGKFTGNIGLNYHPTKSTDLRAMLSTGFRAPNIDDVGKVFESEPGAVVVPNKDLKDEYAYSGEIGISQNIGKIASLDVSVYYVYLDDALVRRDYQINGQDSIIYQGEMSRVQAIQNAAKAYSYGIEARLDVYLNRKLSLFSMLNYQKGEEELDNGVKAPMRHTAPLLLRGGLDFKSKKLTAQIYAVYNDKISNSELAPSEQEKDYMYAQDKEGKPYSPSWYTLNVKTMYQWNQNLQFSAGWENITDQRYRPYSSGIVSAGSNLILSVRYNF